MAENVIESCINLDNAQIIESIQNTQYKTWKIDNKMYNKDSEEHKRYEIFKKWKCGNINIRSGKERDEGAKLYSITKEISKAGLSFCCLQEIKYRNSGRKLIQLDNGEKYEFLWCGTKKRRTAGVGIIIRVDKEIEIKDPDICDPRLMAIDLKIFGFNLRIINAYAPTEISSDSLKDNFYRILRKASVKREKHQKIIIMGDFNAKTSIAYRKCNFDGVELVQDENCNDNGYRMKNFCRNFKLGIASTFFEYPIENRLTWYSCDKKTKRINDYVLAERYVQQYITDCIVQPDIDFDSDHRVLVTEMNTPKTKKARWVKRNVVTKTPIPDIKLLKDDLYQRRYVNEVEINLQRNQKKADSTSEENSSRLLEILKTAVTKTIPPKASTRQDNEIWKNDTEFNHIIDLRQSTARTSATYKDLTKKLKKRINFLRNKRLKNEANAINLFATNKEVEALYRGFTNDNSTFRNAKSTNKCQPTKLKEHYIKHFNRDTEKETPVELEIAPKFIESLREQQGHVNIDPPTSKELLEVIRKLKNGKAANDISAEFIKAAIKSNAFLDEMASLYIEIWKTLEIPKSWSHTKLVAIWKGSKKGNLDDPTAYRGLQVGSSLCKILIVVIINRIKTWYEEQICDQQQGFRSKRGTTDGIFITKQIQQISHKMKKPLYVLFVDLTAAFDKIEREWLFRSIRQRIPGSQKIVDILQKLYSYTTTALSETPEDMFELILGVRQGGPESPLLYNLYMDYVMRVFMENCNSRGIEFPRLFYKIHALATSRGRSVAGFNKTDWSGYADDLMLVFDSKKDLQKALDEMNSTFDRFSLKLNSSKTKTMIFNFPNDAEYPEKIAQIANENIANVKSFRFLGSEIRYDQPNTGDTEIELRIDCAESKFYQYSKKFFNHDIALKTRTKIFDALVRSRLVYACQTWSLTVRQLQRIKASYMGMLRKMTRNGYRRIAGTYRYALNKEAILKICGTTCVGNFIARQQKKYLAHVIRMDDSCMAKRLLFNNNECKRPGRQVTILSMVLAKEECTADEFYRGATERRF